MPPLFESLRLVVRELQFEEVPALQALFEANPAYFLAVNGRAPDPDEAQREFDELPPAHLSYGTRWFAGVFDRTGASRGSVILVSDLPAHGVWHTALFFLAHEVRGTGAAMELHTALESKARICGAQWLRLAVIEGNGRAERFWSKCGYSAVRVRDIVNASGQARTARVMVKALTGGSIPDYLQLAPRDHPDSSLP
jgi:GNAT superfamily N-acetyltransferase